MPIIRSSTERLIAIDPGLFGHTGFAIWYRQRVKMSDIKEFKLYDLTPQITGKVKRTDFSWEADARHIAHHLRAYASRFEQAVIEMPEFWSGSAKSFTSTARGDLFKLSFLVGAIYYALSRIGVNVTLVSPRQWKGQLSKEMVNRRIQRILNNKEHYPDHEADAVGIGLYAMEKL